VVIPRFVTFYWRCAKRATRGCLSAANSWQWLFGVAFLVAIVWGINKFFGEGTISLPQNNWLGIPVATFIAFVITFSFVFIGRFANVPVTFFHDEKRRADELQQQINELKGAEKPIYVNDMRIVVLDPTPQLLSPILLIGRMAQSGARLRIVLEHSHYLAGMGWAGWTDESQVVLGELKDVIAGQQIRMPIVYFSQQDCGESLIWGAPDGPPIDAIQKGKKYRARIRLIWGEASQQRPFHFLLTRRSNNDQSDPIIVITEDEFNFIKIQSK
jgi:hypothetical protein